MRHVLMTGFAATLALSPFAADADTLAKLRDTGRIVLGVQESSIPFSYLDDQAKVIGYSVDLCMGIVDALRERLEMPELAVETVPVTSSTRIPLIVNGTIDLQCGSTTNNAERRQQVDFSYPFFFAAAKVMVPADSEVATVDDLKGKVVVATAGGTPHRVMAELSEERGLDLELPTVKDHAEGVLTVETGRADAVANDDVLLYGLRANSRQPSSWRVLDEPLSTEPYGLILRKDDPAFKEAVNTALADMYADGTAARLYERWFQSPIPPRSVNLELPPSAALQETWADPQEIVD